MPRATTLREMLFNETSRFAIGAGTTLVLLYFMLAMGDKFLRRLVAALPDFRTKKQVVEITHQLQSDMSHYLLTVSAINVAFGAVVAVAMFASGMPNALLWGVMAAILNYIPFLGPHRLSDHHRGGGAAELSGSRYRTHSARPLHRDRRARGQCHHADDPGAAPDPQSGRGGCGAPDLGLRYGASSACCWPCRCWW